MKSVNTKGHFIFYRQLEGDEEQELYVYWKYYYSPGKMYLRNGDPGYPPEEDIDFEVRDEYNKDVTDTLTEQEIDDIEEKIRSLGSQEDYDDRYDDEL